MKLQNEKIVFLRNTGESWATFENQDGVHALPKYDSFIMIPEGKVGSTVDYRVTPKLRQEKYHKEASRWATHFATIAQFVKSDKMYLFVCEDNIELLEAQIPQIEDMAKTPGIKILAPEGKAYILDKATAKIIQDNGYIFYANWGQILQDLKNLNLINLETTPILKKIGSTSSILLHIFFIVLLLTLALGIFLLLCPLDGFWTKNTISLAKVTTTKEAVVSAEGTGMSSHQDSMLAVD
jgi:hypothetical protein